MLRILYYCLKFWHRLKTENEALVSNETGLTISEDYLKQGLWSERK
jgi:hypothetical protein